MNGEVKPATDALIRTLIVDDEDHARLRLRQLLKNAPDFQIIAECGNGRQAVESVQRERPDLLFLDVQMPRLNGLQVCQAIAAGGLPLPLVIFVTAYDEYALQAFEFHAIDYLLKPFDKERFEKTLQHAREQFRRARGTDPRLAALLEDLKNQRRRPDRLVFKKDGRVVFVRIESIDWVEADGNYVRLRAGIETHYIRETLAVLEAQLPADKFMRISRSVLVNLDRVKELQPLFYGDYVVILHDGARLNLSRHYRDRVQKLLTSTP